MKHVKIASGSPHEGSVSELQVVNAAPGGASALADWQHFSDPLSHGERFIRAVSRAAGIAALLGGAAVTLFALPRFF